jgi:CDP-diacylglycerol--serine O-phosphatidyltransferase
MVNKIINAMNMEHGLLNHMKQIPNLFTLLNLFAGCLAIVCIMQTGVTISVDASGDNLVVIPENIYVASILIGAAAVIDFLDGFVARLLKASSEMGKQLDSLADVVSFGVAPGLIAYQFLRLSYAQQADGLDTSMLWLLPAFILPCAGAYRLARFNIDATQSHGFKGVPIPAAGLLFASFPLIYWYSNNEFLIRLLLNKWFWYAAILIISYLMVSQLPMMAMKFSGITLKKLLPALILAVILLAGALSFGWLTVPITFIAYVILSLSLKQQES